AVSAAHLNPAPSQCVALASPVRTARRAAHAAAPASSTSACAALPAATRRSQIPPAGDLPEPPEQTRPYGSPPHATAYPSRAATPHRTPPRDPAQVPAISFALRGRCSALLADTVSETY